MEPGRVGILSTRNGASQYQLANILRVLRINMRQYFNDRHDNRYLGLVRVDTLFSRLGPGVATIPTAQKRRVCLAKLEW